MNKWICFFIFQLTILNYGSDLYLNDLHEMYQQIQNNHPGMYNSLDSDFQFNLQLAYNKALNQLSQIDALQDYQLIIKEFVQSFDDTHLGVHWLNNDKDLKSFDLDKHFTISKFDKNCYWITLPTFALDGLQNEAKKAEFINVLSKIAHLKKAKKIVFDIRYNSGGNSAYGSLIVDALFSKIYAEQQKNKYNAEVAIDWRASFDNLQYLISLAKILDHNLWISLIVQGVQKSLNLNLPYYREISETHIQKKFFKHKVKSKIFVIIDQSNVSAALDFLDELKMMDYPITLIGETTQADRVYMECRSISLPSKLGLFYFPIKVYRNRLRQDNEPYFPDIFMNTRLNDELKKLLIKI